MPALEVEQRFQKYRIIGKLGTSLVSDSYVAENVVARRKVTLKLIQPGKALPESTRRQFFREMQGISTINHPSLAALLDYGENDGQLYIARRYIPAGSLLDDEGRTHFKPILNIPSAIRYTHQLAQGLHALHKQGFVHGSLTLSNLLVLPGSSPEQASDTSPFLIADMNLTHFVRRLGQIPNQILPITSAPEQALKRTTPASDQFALAVILFFWLTGRFPYLGTPAEMQQQKQKAAIPTLSNLNAKVSIQHEGILRRALSASPEERYPTILAFSTALVNALSTKQPSFIFPSTQNIQATPEPALSNGFHMTTSTDPAPKPDPAPTPQPQPDPVPQPEPDPAPQPDPQPVPPPMPMPEPGPLPVPTPDPKIVPEKDPTSPEKQPQPAPAPFPKPEPNPVPFPDPEIVPEPTPEIKPGTIGTPPPQTPFNPQAIEEAISSSREPLAAETTEPEEENSSSPTTFPCLLITSPYTENPYYVPVKQDVLTLGRAGSSDILLDTDPLTSRHHALIRREEDGYVLQDRQSATGVRVNDRPLEADEAYPLANADEITIGNYKLTFYATAQSQPETEDLPDASDTALSH